MKLVVGLGNPGPKYVGTRHNIGFAVVDELAAGAGVDRFQARFQGQAAELLDGDRKLLLLKPETFMNLSGRSVRAALDFFHLPVSDLLVVCDDMNLPLGKLRFRPHGSHGGQNGLRDIQNHLGGPDYARLRIGVDAPAGADAAEHVLGRFKPGERPQIEEAVRTAAQAVIVWARDGVELCMNRYNGDTEPGKKTQGKKG